MNLQSGQVLLLIILNSKLNLLIIATQVLGSSPFTPRTKEQFPISRLIPPYPTLLVTWWTSSTQGHLLAYAESSAFFGMIVFLDVQV